MITLMPLKDIDGNTNFVSPKHIVMLQPLAIKSGNPRTVVFLSISFPYIVVPGTPKEVRKLILDYVLE